MTSCWGMVVPGTIPSAFVVLPENPVLFQRPGVGSAHKKMAIYECLICHAKI